MGHNAGVDMERLRFVAAMIRSENTTEHFGGLQIVWKMLRVSSQPPIKQVTESLPPEDLARHLLDDEHPGCQFVASWCLCNIAAGDAEDTATIVRSGCLSPLIRILNTSDSLPLLEQTAWIIGNVAADREQSSAALAEQGAVNALLRAFDVVQLAYTRLTEGEAAPDSDTPLSATFVPANKCGRMCASRRRPCMCSALEPYHNIVWSIAIFVTAGKKSEELTLPLEQQKRLLPVFLRAATSERPEVAVDACYALLSLARRDQDVTDTLLQEQHEPILHAMIKSIKSRWGRELATGCVWVRRLAVKLLEPRFDLPAALVAALGKIPAMSFENNDDREKSRRCYWAALGSLLDVRAAQGPADTSPACRRPRLSGHILT